MAMGWFLCPMRAQLHGHETMRPCIQMCQRRLADQGDCSLALRGCQAPRTQACKTGSRAPHLCMLPYELHCEAMSNAPDRSEPAGLALFCSSRVALWILVAASGPCLRGGFLGTVCVFARFTLLRVELANTLCVLRWRTLS